MLQTRGKGGIKSNSWNNIDLKTSIITLTLKHIQTNTYTYNPPALPWLFIGLHFKHILANFYSILSHSVAFGIQRENHIGKLRTLNPNSSYQYLLPLTSLHSENKSLIPIQSYDPSQQSLALGTYCQARTYAKVIRSIDQETEINDVKAHILKRKLY